MQFAVACWKGSYPITIGEYAMDLDLLKRVNRLWHEIYPYLADQILEAYQRGSGNVLELGPFSGGISEAMAKRHPNLEITIADESPQVLTYLREEMVAAGLSDRVSPKETDFRSLVFEDSRFDLIISRGVFFFLDEEGALFKEIYRVLDADGLAFIGGGYGKDTPQALIDKISEESRVLNNKLGRKRFRIEDFERIVVRSGLGDHCNIVEQGGLWVVIKK